MKGGYRHIVILTGAGISAESGIKTFRAADGLWEAHRIEDVATPEGFAANPALVHQFYNQRRRQLLGGEVHPNPAHLALARLEAEHPGTVLIVTQNIDDLHQRAGSRQLIAMHGEMLKVRCTASGELHRVTGDVQQQDLCPCCDRPATLRPHVVWFGELPLQMDDIYQALAQCDLFVAIGTSGHVYPAAGFVATARAGGAHTVEINLEPSAVHSDFAEQRRGPAGTEVPTLVAELLAA